MDHRCNSCSGTPPSWHRPETRRNPGELPSEKATRRRAAMFAQTCRLSRLDRELTQVPPWRRDSQTLPFPPDGIAFYSKNSAASHLQLSQWNPDRQACEPQRYFGFRLAWNLNARGENASPSSLSPDRTGWLTFALLESLFIRKSNERLASVYKCVYFIWPNDRLYGQVKCTISIGKLLHHRQCAQRIQR